MTQVQIPGFFPFEIIILIITSSIFSVIYFYLRQSLNPKKDQLADSIEKKINRRIEENLVNLNGIKFFKDNISYGINFYHEITSAETPEKVDDIVKKYIVGPIPTNNPQPHPKYGAYASWPGNAPIYVDEYKLLKEAIRLKKYHIYILALKKEKDKVPLRDLERIYSDLDVIETIYKQRIKSTIRKLFKQLNTNHQE